MIEHDASPVVVAGERVVRGGDWLDRRWREGGPKLKQLAIATRADGLTLPQFLERWRGRPARPGRRRFRTLSARWPTCRTTPWSMTAGSRPTTRSTEVYFDDADSLLALIAYLERELAGGADNDLVRASWFLAVSEDPIRLPL